MLHIVVREEGAMTCSCIFAYAWTVIFEIFEFQSVLPLVKSSQR